MKGLNPIILQVNLKSKVLRMKSIYMEKKVVFLDETTNALDNKTEHEILSELKKTLKNKTVFVISHSKNLYKYVDKIITIENKKVTIKNARY